MSRDTAKASLEVAANVAHVLRIRLTIVRLLGGPNMCVIG